MLNNEQKIEIINSNIDNFWRLMACSPAIEIIEENNIMLCQSKSNLSRHEMLNSVLRSYFPEQETIERVNAICAKHDAHEKAFTWLVNESEAPANLRSALFSSGFESIANYRCKILLLDNYQEIPMTSAAEFRWVSSKEELNDWLIPQVAVKNLDQDSAKEYLQVRLDCLANHDNYHYLIGYLHGKPVLSATLFIKDQVAGFFNGCALPEIRRQGIGTDSVIFRLNYAKQLGCQFAIAETSRLMDGITAELGFETLLTFHELGYGLH